MDPNGYQYKYVPKDSIFTANDGDKKRKKSDNTYIYMKKSQNNSEPNSASKSEMELMNKNMQNLLKNLKPEELLKMQEEDEDVKKILSRRVSMNESNVIGTNFERYNDQKPS